MTLTTPTIGAWSSAHPLALPECSRLQGRRPVAELYTYSQGCIETVYSTLITFKVNLGDVLGWGFSPESVLYLRTSVYMLRVPAHLVQQGFGGGSHSSGSNRIHNGAVRYWWKIRYDHIYPDWVLLHIVCYTVLYIWGMCTATNLKNG